MVEVLNAIAVLIVVIIIFFLAWYIPHVIAKKGSAAQRGKNITILEKIPVSKDSYIMLLKTFNKVLVVGVTPGGMTNLRELESGDYTAEDMDTNNQSFASVLKTALRESMPEGRMRNAFDRIVKRKNSGDENEK